MERIPIEGETEIHDLVSGVYDLVFTDELRVADLDLYYIDSEHVEAEIELPYLGLNREAWQSRWTPERKLEVLLHEFAHVEEAPGEPDHGPAFYDRLAALTTIAEAHQADLEALFGEPLDFRAVHDHVVDSVNEHTIEHDIESVETRRQILREQFSGPRVTQ